MDTHNLGANAGQWFEMGQRAGGRTAGVGSALKVLVDTLKEDRAIKAELEGKKELIDYTAEAENKYKDPAETYAKKLAILNAESGVEKNRFDLGLPPLGLVEQPNAGLGTPDIAPVKSQISQLDEGYEMVPSGDVKETLYGGQKVGYKVQPTEAKSLKAKVDEMRALQELKSEVPTVQKQNDLLAAKQQLSNIKGMRTLAESIPSGIVGRVGSGTLAAISGGAMSTNKQLYDKQRPAFAVSLYRALTGDTRLSDADAKARALPLLWKVGEADAVRKKSFDYIEKALGSRINLIQSGKYKQNTEGDFITPLEDVLAGANNLNSNLQSFDTEEEAEASGIKGEVIIGGRRARID